MPWHELLFSQGFGTRRICHGLVEQGHVQFPVETAGTWQTVTYPLAEVVATPGLPFRVMGQDWSYHPLAYIVLHKPAGTECSHKPGRWPSIYSLLPAPLRQRPAAGAVQGVQAVGRLDQDTTGLLLLSDDGVFIHRMASPRHHVPKVYQVRCAEPISPGQIRQLLAGVELREERQTVRASAAVTTGTHTLDLTLTEGKYHQVKRMLTSVGNAVVQLHRSRIGQFDLPADLAPGQWRWLSPQELAHVGAKTG
ncbi:MAG: 16S rRNA pseudouridine(516) synthase [Alphaproteobacteria bacterium]|nr:16S rRNA pseudouridine(516) synthase [Alphaproteobacteria bacterium]